MTSAPAVEPLPGLRESTVSVLVLQALVSAVERLGVAPAALLRAAQLRPDQLTSAETRLPRSQISRACEVALDLTGLPALGLLWAESLRQGTLAPVSHLIVHSATLREGLDSLAQFYRLLCDDTFYEVVDLADEVTVRCLPLAGESLRFQRFCSEMMTAGFLMLVREFSPRALVKRVSFEYAAPAYHAEYARIFGTAACFERPFTGIVFDRAVLDLPAPLKNDDVRAALQSVAERRLSRITQQTPYAHRVRDLLVQHRSPSRPDMATVARSLGLSVRSLRRRLADEARTFNTIATEALSVVAKHLLQDDQRTIQETAYELGFSETSAFHRAFKRWTGTTPNAYRRAHQRERERRLRH